MPQTVAVEETVARVEAEPRPCRARGSERQKRREREMAAEKTDGGG